MNTYGKTVLDLAYKAITNQDKGEAENEIIKKNTISKMIAAGCKRRSQVKSEVLTTNEENKE